MAALLAAYICLVTGIKSSCDIQQFKGNILKYLHQCPKLKILKIDCFKTGYMCAISKTISKKFKNVNELHLTLRDDPFNNQGYYNRPNDLTRFLNNITQNLPNLCLLCLTYGLSWTDNNTDVAQVCQQIAVEKGIRIEIINI